MMLPSEADLEDVMIYSEEESETIARHGELLALNTAIEQAYHEGLDRGMREAGFASVDDRLARLAVPPGRWGATCYTRNGLVACLGGDDWQVHAQGTGHLLATLPEEVGEVGVVARFVRKAERVAFWPLVEEIGPELRDELRAAADRERNIYEGAAGKRVLGQDAAIRMPSGIGRFQTCPRGLPAK
jgi:hypothetical protein